MTMDRQDRVQAEKALDAALMRWQEAERHTTDADSLYAAVAEVLWWVVALDEWHQLDDPGYSAGRFSNDPDRRLMLGLRYARNRVSHGLRGLLKLSESGFGFPMRFPLKFSEFTWKPLPIFPEDNSHPDQRKAYDDVLMGQMTRNTLQRACDLLVARV